MKYVTTSNFFIIATLTILLVSCSTDTLVLEEPEIIFPESVELIESSLLGSVEDEAGLPVSDALVTCHSCLPKAISFDSFCFLKHNPNCLTHCQSITPIA